MPAGEYLVIQGHFLAPVGALTQTYEGEPYGRKRASAARYTLAVRQGARTPDSRPCGGGRTQPPPVATGGGGVKGSRAVSHVCPEDAGRARSASAGLVPHGRGNRPHRRGHRLVHFYRGGRGCVRRISARRRSGTHVRRRPWGHYRRR